MAATVKVLLVLLMLLMVAVGGRGVVACAASVVHNRLAVVHVAKRCFLIKLNAPI
jgi:hypothetical protein